MGSIAFELCTKSNSPDEWCEATVAYGFYTGINGEWASCMNLYVYACTQSNSCVLLRAFAFAFSSCSGHFSIFLLCVCVCMRKLLHSEHSFGLLSLLLFNKCFCFPSSAWNDVRRRRMHMRIQSMDGFWRIIIVIHIVVAVVMNRCFHL